MKSVNGIFRRTSQLVLAFVLALSPIGSATTFSAGFTEPSKTPATLQLGESSPEPLQIVAGGTHTCAVTESGGVVCWGANSLGQLGDGTTGTERDATPGVAIGLRTGVRSVSLAWGRTCAQTEYGRVYCWGGSLYPSAVPKLVPGLGDDIIQVVTGEHHSCALSSTGEVFCWGLNHYGQLGDGTVVNSETPVTAIQTGASQLAIYGYTTCAVLKNGEVTCWGSSARGQLGNGVVPPNPDYHALVPVNVVLQNGSKLAGASQVGLGITFGCALVGGNVYCWGTDRFGQLGDGTSNLGAQPYATPVKASSGVGVLDGVDQISVGAESTCVHLTDGQLKCWGQNFFGQIGNGTILPNASDGGVALPAVVKNLAGTGPFVGANSVSVGDNHACAFTDWEAARPFYCWGSNNFYELGSGSLGYDSQSLPVAVVSLSDLPLGGFAPMQQIAAGGAHTCALTNGDGLQCWGDNSRGQLGNGTEQDSDFLIQVVGSFNDLNALELGAEFSCVVNFWGGVECWGANEQGQLGNGTNQDSSLPTLVMLGSAQVLKLAAGDRHVCGVTAAGGVLCWGDNSNGQLGDGTTEDRNLPVVTIPTGVRNIAAGGSTTCVLMDTGQVKCWGLGDKGQLGNGSSGTDYYQAIPVDVVSESGLLSGVEQLDLGAQFACAVSADGLTYCWGDNASGQLGQGTQGSISTRAIPVLREAGGSALVGIKQVSLGSAHACGRMYTNRLKCWGLGESGQLGNGSLGAGVSSNVPGTVLDHFEVNPEEIPYLVGVEHVSAGGFHTCAFLSWSDPLPYRCWGENENGQLGNGEVVLTQSAIQLITEDQPYPNPVADTLFFAGRAIKKIAAGASHACSITHSESVRCWGDNGDGQLGDGSITDSNVPVDVLGLDQGVKQLALGSNFSCALTEVGGVKCWGRNNYGQLGDGTDTNSLVPVDVIGLSSGVRKISSSFLHTCALLATGAVKCWGYNIAGQLGNDSYVNSNVPVDVIGLSGGMVGIAAGGTFSCALTAVGGVKCWGRNSSGELGNGGYVDAIPHPVDVIGLSSGVLALTAGNRSSCVLLSSGVECWGSNAYGQLGNNDTTLEKTHTPVSVVGLGSDTVQLISGTDHHCLITAEKTVKCWGFNIRGQLGDGTNDNRALPVDTVGDLAGVSALAAGNYFTCALSPATSLLNCWGSNDDGQFGNGTNVSSNIPVSSNWWVFDGLILDHKDEVFLPGLPDTVLIVPEQPVEEPIPITTHLLILDDIAEYNRMMELVMVYDPSDQKPELRFHTYYPSSPLPQDIQTSNSPDAIDESKINLYRFDGKAWQPILPCTGCYLDTTNNLLVASLDKPGIYALLSPISTNIYLPIIVK